MNTIITETPNKFGSRLFEGNNTNTLLVAAGALDDFTPPPVDEDERKRREDKNSLHKPPSPTRPITVRLAEGALNRILAGVGAQVDGKTLTVELIKREKIELVDMNTMSTTSSLKRVEFCAVSANLKALALELRSKGAEEVRSRINEKLRQQIDAAIKAEEQAKKAGIFTAIIDTLVSVAEVVSGIAKLVAGDVAGGIMDLGAGCAGLVKATCEYLAVLDPENADKYQEIAEIAGKVQLACEIAGMMVDVASAARGIVAAKALPKATETVMNKGYGKLLEETIAQARNELGQAVTKEAKAAITDAAKESISGIASELGREVSMQFAEQVTNNLAKQGSRLLGQGHLIKAFSQKAIEELVAKAVQNLALEALKSGAKSSAKELTEAAAKEVMKSVIKKAVETSLTCVPNRIKFAASASLHGGNNIANAEFHRQAAEWKKLISDLANDNTFLQFILAEFEQFKKQIKDSIDNDMQQAGNALSDANKSTVEIGAMLSKIAKITV